ncbi:MAG: hypothetical protein O3A00_28725, partial [Planctomycetota bacterium]|nr:hypothetical protein [Planctomycetota bacterium]
VLADSSMEALIACGSQQSVLEGTRQIAATGIPILLLPHADQGAEFAYELMLIRDDTGTCLVPAFLASQLECVRQFAASIAKGDLGRVRFLRFDRDVPSRSGSLTTQQLDAELLQDVDLLRSLCRVAGSRDADATAEENRIDIDQVTGLISGVTDVGVSTATVTLAGAHVPESTWAISAVSVAENDSGDRQSWKLSVKGDDRTAVLSGFNRHDDVRLSFEPNLDHSDSTSSNANSLLNHFEHETQRLRSSAGTESNRPESNQQDLWPVWNDLTRAFEIIDARHRSIRRRRTIDLYFETTSERNQFKTQMTALGCGVMSLTFFGLLLYLVVASLVELPEGVLQVLRVIWLLPLMGFIGLQLLYFITRPSSNE